MSTIYSQPEAYGLTAVADVDVAGVWEFDIFAVWTDGRALYWDTDSGCSCPLPFDGVALPDVGVGRPVDCLRALDAWQAERSRLAEHPREIASLRAAINTWRAEL